jgi:hypothetical protein
MACQIGETMTERTIDELGPVDYLVVEFSPSGPGPSPIAKAAVVGAAVTPSRRRF